MARCASRSSTAAQKPDTWPIIAPTLGITPAEAACIGDGANDLDMLEAAGFGVAFHGKPLLREKIRLQLNHTDLTGLLYLQGYTADAFITG